MISATVDSLLESIEKYSLTGLMSAANCVGPMGAGIAGAIRKAGGKEIQDDAFRICKLYNPQPGEAYSTISGKLSERGIKRIIHAATMRNPGGYTSYDIIDSAFRSALNLAEKEKITTLGCTALGTGIGKLDPAKVGEIMLKIAKAYHASVNIVFVDFNEKFINVILKELKDLGMPA